MTQQLQTPLPEILEEDLSPSPVPTTLTDLVERFNELVGDNVMHDATVTINIFSNILNDIRSRKQRSLFHQSKAAEHKQRRQRLFSPPPTYSHVKFPKNIKFAQSD